MARGGGGHRRKSTRLLICLTLAAVGIVVLEPLVSIVVPLLIFSLAIAVLIGALRR